MPVHPQAQRFLSQYYRLNLPKLQDASLESLRQMTGTTAPIDPNCPVPACIEDVLIDAGQRQIPARIYRPDRAGPLPVCLYFHGGGWVLNSVATHDEVTRWICVAAGQMVISVDYRLAPEHPYPAALDDAWSALNWVSQNASNIGIDPALVSVAGDSAGANLAAALCLMTRDRSGPLIACQVLAYPVVDCDFDRPSYLENADGYFLSRDDMCWFWDQYAASIDREHPYASPIRGELTGLPPALVLTAEFDPLRDEGEAYVAALAEAGVPVSSRRFDGMIHGFLRRWSQFDLAREAYAEIATFFQNQQPLP